jgi:hypothetical protein
MTAPAIGLVVVALLVTPLRPLAAAETPRPHEGIAWRLIPPDNLEYLRVALQGGFDPHHPLIEALRRHGRLDEVEPENQESAAPEAARPLGAQTTGSLAPDAIVNLRMASCTTCKNLPTGQDEPSVAVFGNQVVVGFNNYGAVCISKTREDYAYSTDGGLTYTDALGFPPTEQNGQMYGDPAVAVNRKTGNFYISGLHSGGGATFTGVGCAKGQFSGANFVIDRITRTATNPNPTTSFYDRPFMTVDSLSGNVYFTWAAFGLINNAIMTQAFDSNLNPIGPPITLAPEDSSRGYQDAQPAVGPNGEVYVTWWETTLWTDDIAISKSTDFGQTFGPKQIVSSRFHSVVWNGAPGQQRGFGFVVPNIVVDNTTGPHRGRAYVAWEGALDYLAGPFNSLPSTVEQEPNGTLAAAKTFTPGQKIRGAAGIGDIDFWKFTGQAGQTFAVLSDWDSTGPSVSLYVHHVSNPADLSTDRVITYSGLLQNGLIFSLPSDGTYYAEIKLDPNGTQLSPYVLATALVSPGPNDIALDVRDPLLSWSDDGTNWSTPVRLPDNSPGFESVYPAIAVDGSGRVHCAWLDYRDDAVYGDKCRTWGTSSGDGGVTWGPNRPLADVGAVWTKNLCISNGNVIGDYMHMSADGDRVITAFTDGRFNDPDIFADASLHAEAIACPGALSIVASPDTVVEFNLTNTGNYTRGFNWTLADTRGWIIAASPAGAGAVSLDPGQSLAVSATVVPPSCGTDSTVVSLTVTDPFFPGNTQACATRVSCVAGPTPALVSLVGADVLPDRVTLTWFGRAPGTEASVYRRGPSESWATIGRSSFDGAGRLVFEDRSVEPGARYAYRLGWIDSGGEQLSAETWVVIPVAYALEFSLPNPNPSAGNTRMSYALSRPGLVQIDLFGATGARVRTLESGVRDAGPHQLVWDGTDDRGRSVPSGVYFARLVAEGRSLRHVVMIVR